MLATLSPDPADHDAGSLDRDMPKPLLFIHLSDLHFSSRPADSKWELDQTIRTELSHDLRSEVQKRGGATALWVSGDVAYSGARDEYIKARDFLVNLCADLGVPTENVWVVPGNHDVKLACHADYGTTEARFALMAAASHRIDSVLETLMNDPEKARSLLAPLANYFSFAADFECQPQPSELTWDAYFELGDGYELHVLGVNSALVSDKNDKSNCPQLVVGSVQTQLTRKEGVIHVTVCHHPPCWIKDRAQLEAMFDNNAQLQVTGHEHHFSVSEQEPLKVAAGALHPERDKTGWQPHYNLISIEVVQSGMTGGNARVQITVASRIWKDARWIENPAFEPSGEVRREVELDEVATISAQSLNAPAEQYEQGPADQRIERIANRRRRLAYRLARLYEGEQRAIAERFGMTLGELTELGPGGLVAAVVDRAEEQHRLADLWDAVERAHGVADQSANPYLEES
jgi:hypothetical protein